MSCAPSPIPDRTPEPSSQAKWGDACLFAGFLVLYLATKAATQSFDAVWYAIKVESGVCDGMFHPHHLLHMPIVWVLWRGLSLIGVHIRAIDIAQVLSAFAGAGAVVFFRRLLSMMRRPGPFSYAGAAVYGATGAFWHEATDGEPYAIALFFSTACLYFGLSGESRRAIILGGLFAGVAICFHQESLFLVIIPVLAWLFNRTGSKDLARFVLFGGTAARAAFAMQLGAFLAFCRPRFDSFVGWILHYPVTMPTYRAFAEAPVRDSIRGLTTNAVFSTLRAFSATCVLIGLALAAAYVGYCWVSQRKKLQNSLLCALAVATVLGSAFAFWWDPFNHKFWMFPFCSGMLLSLSVMRMPAPTVVLSCLALVLFSVNLHLHFLWRSVPEYNPYQARVDAVSGMEKDAWIVFATVSERLQGQMIYFGGYRNTATSRQFGIKVPPDATERVIQRGHPIYVFLSRGYIEQKTKQYVNGQMREKEQKFWERFTIAPDPDFPLPDGKSGFYRLRLRKDGPAPLRGCEIARPGATGHARALS